MLYFISDNILTSQGKKDNLISYSQKNNVSSRRKFNNRGRSGGFRSQQNNRKGPKKDYIARERFIKAAKVVEEVKYIPENSFDSFEIHENLKNKIRERGYVEPSPIQDQVIPHGINNVDILGIANTGTGKTMAFALPVMNKLMHDRNSKALVLAPTRELAEQVLNECKSLFSNTKLAWALLIGGAPIGKQFRDLHRRPSLVIGTPGRVKDHIERGSLDLSQYNTVVLDEVDRMLDMGFINDIREILSHVSSDSRQSYFFSATMDRRVEGLIDEFSNDLMTVSVKNGESSDLVEQDVVDYGDDDDKLDKLIEILDSSKGKVIVFDDTRRQVEKLSKTLFGKGYKVDSIHGGKNQGQRKRALDRYKRDEVDVLVATDVAARGIDVDGISHVINYSTPQSYSDYVHRIGRAGRAGKTGFAKTFLKK